MCLSTLFRSLVWNNAQMIISTAVRMRNPKRATDTVRWKKIIMTEAKSSNTSRNLKREPSLTIVWCRWKKQVIGWIHQYLSEQEEWMPRRTSCDYSKAYLYLQPETAYELQYDRRIRHNRDQRRERLELVRREYPDWDRSIQALYKHGFWFMGKHIIY